MFLKSLKIHGFKSFAEKTTFEFHQGVTAVVGPNGCGKSNVVDAIRWVLGETSAKALRGGEMADVIFNGTDKRQPLGMAEVSLTIGGCDGDLETEFSEVQVSRRVFRDGKSDYLLNGNMCRLRDIHELFMDTGIGRNSYSFMEQGKIDLLLSSKPEDRRAVFEEAAGITKFKAQKKEALRKLDYTEANLLRITDIIEEVKRQMGSMQRQAAKARRYQILLEGLRVLDTHFCHRNYAELNAERGELRTSISSLSRAQQEREQGVVELEENLVTGRHELHELESLIAKSTEEALTLKNQVQAANSRIQFNDERAVELNTLVNRNREDIGEVETKLQAQESELAEAERNLEQLLGSIQKQEQRLQEQLREYEETRTQARDRTAALNELQQKGSAVENQLVSARAAIANTRGQVESGQNRLDEVRTEAAKLGAARAEKEAEIQRFEAELTAHVSQLEDQIHELREAEHRQEQAAEKLSELETRLRNVQSRLAEKQSRLQVLRQLTERGEGLDEGTRAVLKGLDQPELIKNGLRGTLASLIEVESRFIAPVEAAIGPLLESLLVADSTLAETIIDSLTKGRRGRAALISEDLLPPGAASQMLTLPERATAWALDVVKPKPKVRPLIDRLLENVLIVDNLSIALKLKPQLGRGVSIATLTGEFISSHGVIHGGAGKGNPNSLLQRKAEVAELEKETAQLAEELQSLENEKTALKTEIEATRENVADCRKAVQQGQVRRSTLESQRSLLDRELQQVAGKGESLEWEQKDLENRRDASERRLEELAAERDTAENELNAIRERIAETQRALAQSSQRETESSHRVNELRTALAVEHRTEQALNEQRQPMGARLRELQELLARRQRENQSHAERIDKDRQESARLKSEVEEAEVKCRTMENDLRQLGEQRRGQSASLDELESKITSHRREISQISQQRGSEEVKTTQLDLRLESLTDYIKERHGVDLDSFHADNYELMLAIEEHKKRQRRSRRPQQAVNGVDAANAELPETKTPATVDPSPPAGDETELPEDEGPDWDFVAAAVGELKQRLDSMGPVNLDAIQEFEELEERYKFLEQQHTDLVNSKEELLRVIAKINTTTRQMFAETFAQVAANFREMFRELFGSAARANLLLVNEDDPLESGIEVIAKPPGKKLQSISLLSGGERAMTAVALLFSIYMVKPSPFCILDEIDAPLDESNINRFLKMLDRFLDESQFVIITHNKRTMTRGDVMYGVTMEEFGVSKLVGVKMTAEEEGGTAGRKAEADAGMV